MNKRLIIIFVSVAVVIVLAVVGAVMLTVGDVSVVVNSESQNVDKTNIVNVSGIKRGSSIFTVDEEKAINNIEKNYPYIKAIKVERVFPNKVRIEITERIAILSVKLSDSDEYLVLDRELKVLEILPQEQLNERNLVAVNGFTFNNADIKYDDLLGSFLNKESGVVESISETILSLETYGNVNDRLASFAHSFTVNEEQNYISIKTNMGVSLLVRLNTTKSISEQVPLLYNTLDKLSNSEREKDNYILIDNDSKIHILPSIPDYVKNKNN